MLVVALSHCSIQLELRPASQPAAHTKSRGRLAHGACAPEFAIAQAPRLLNSSGVSPPPGTRRLASGAFARPQESAKTAEVRNNFCAAQYFISRRRRSRSRRSLESARESARESAQRAESQRAEEAKVSEKRRPHWAWPELLTSGLSNWPLLAGGSSRGPFARPSELDGPCASVLRIANWLACIYLRAKSWPNRRSGGQLSIGRQPASQAAALRHLFIAIINHNIILSPGWPAGGRVERTSGRTKALTARGAHLANSRAARQVARPLVRRRRRRRRRLRFRSS